MEIAILCLMTIFFGAICSLAAATVYVDDGIYFLLIVLVLVVSGGPLIHLATLAQQEKCVVTKGE